MFEITDEFLAQAGFGMLPPEAKEQMRQNVTNSVQAKITDQLLAAVGEQKLEEFEALLDSEDVPMLLNWCQGNGINLTEIVQNSMNQTMVELQTLHNDALSMVRE